MTDIADRIAADSQELTAAAEADFQAMLSFVRILYDDIPKVRPDARQVVQVLTDLLRAFEAVVAGTADFEGYFFAGQRLLHQETDAPYALARKYAQLLGQIRQHTILLADLTRPQPAKILSTERRTLLTRLVGLIVSRLQADNGQTSPFLLPFFTTRFRYLPFSYVDELGLLGLPPQFVSDLSRPGRLSWLWIDAAATALHRTDQLERWAGALKSELEGQELWSVYRKRYTDSGLRPLSPERQPEAAKFFLEMYHRELFKGELVDRDQGWQMAWLAEFIKDSFWLSLLVEEELAVMVAGLEALVNNYVSPAPDPTLGSPGQPPLSLRLLVGMVYLSGGDSDRLEQLLAAYNQQSRLFKVTFDSRALAELLGTFCRQTMDEAAHPLFQMPASEPERELARLILKPNPLRLSRVKSILDRVDLDQPTLPAEAFDSVSDAYFRPSPAFVTTVEHAPDLASLLSLLSPIRLP